MVERDATGGQARNAALCDYLARAGWSAENLARHVALARETGLAATLHPKTPRRWLYSLPTRSRPCVPRPPWPALVCTVLSRRLGETVTLASLGWHLTAATQLAPADDGLDHEWTPRGATASLRNTLEASDMDRRHFMVITGTALTAFAHSWLLDPARLAAAVQGRRADHAVVDDLERVVEARRRLDDTLGGDTLFRAVREDLRLVTAVLDNASYTDDVGRRLFGLAAEFARLAALQLEDRGNDAMAQRYFITALRAAHSSGDRAVGANILAFMSKQPRKTHSRDAVRLVESALAGADTLTPAVESRLNASLAKSAAWVGDTTVADRALGRMFELTGDVRQAAEPPWIYWWSVGEAHYTAGQVALALGKPRNAEAALRDALMRSDPAFPRTRAQWLTRLAVTRVQLGELDGACRAAGEAATLARRLDSKEVKGRLAEFSKLVRPYSNASAVKNFDARFGHLARPRP